MPALYDRFGVRFQYPENWRLDEQLSQPREVSLNRPNGGYWSVSIYERPVPAEQLISEVVQTMAKEYGSLEARDVTLEVAGRNAVGCDMDFFYLDLVVSATVRVFRGGQRTLLVITQAESRDFDEAERVFDAITYSLVSNEPA